MWHSKLEAPFCYVHVPDLTGKIIETAEKISMYLLESFYSSWPDVVLQTALKQGISLGTTFPINASIAIGKPLYKTYGLIIRGTLGQCQNSVVIKDICKTAFTIRSEKFQLVSGTNHFISF